LLTFLPSPPEGEGLGVRGSGNKLPSLKYLAPRILLCLSKKESVVPGQDTDLSLSGKYNGIVSGKMMAPQKRRTRSKSPVAENIVHTWVGESQFNRGLTYLQQDLVHHTRRRGEELTAICSGRKESSQLYKVRAQVKAGKILQAYCTCSTGKYGVCPHIAATLLYYSRNPDRFPNLSLLGRLKGLFGLK